MLYAIGMNEDDQKKAQVGIVSTGFQGNPCNMHLNDIAATVKKEVDLQKDLYGLVFHTIGVSDGITNGTEGIRSKVQPGDVIVIRNNGPKGAPGMPEMLKPTGAVMGAGLGNDVALITDGRFSGGSHGFVVGHITPETYNGGLSLCGRT